MSAGAPMDGGPGERGVDPPVLLHTLLQPTGVLPASNTPRLWEDVSEPVLGLSCFACPELTDRSWAALTPTTHAGTVDLPSSLSYVMHWHSAGLLLEDVQQVSKPNSLQLPTPYSTKASPGAQLFAVPPQTLQAQSEPHISSCPTWHLPSSYKP